MRLLGGSLALHFDVSAMALRFGETSVAWTSGDRQGQDEYEAVNVAPDVYFVSFLVSATKTECDALIFDTETRRAVHVHNWKKPEAKAGEPRMGQRIVGELAGGEVSAWRRTEPKT